jgi:MFS family permease
MLEQVLVVFQKYPRQFWLMFSGMLISTTGASMIWPFLLIYVSKRLNVSLTAVTSLLTLNAMIGIASSFLCGPLIDHFGRKWIMAFSLAANGLAYVFLGHASTIGQFAILLGLSGAVNPLYRTTADTMIADLIPIEKRAESYALMRLSNNLGVSIGPLIGGFIASSSYTIAFYFAATGMTVYSLLIVLLAKETLPDKSIGVDKTLAQHERFGGYPRILKDIPFISFVFNFSLATICAVLMWTVMPVYANKIFHIVENDYKWIPATNAIMVVTLQTYITSKVKHFSAIPVMMAGAFFYMIAVGGVAFASSFWGFWICVVIMTLGELLIMPTSSTYAANLAPVEMRGRYMSLYSLGWPVAAGIGPLIGGLLNDSIGPRSIWFGGATIGFISVLFFLFLSQRGSPQRIHSETRNLAD